MMKVQIRKWSYGRYSSDNYGAHTLAVAVGGLTLFFSYDTVVGFIAPGKPGRYSENCWRSTTGKHLNWLCEDKSQRLPREIFEQELQTVLLEHGLVL